MLLRNFYNLIGTIIQSNATVRGLLPVTDVYGMQGFLTGQFAQFPNVRTSAYTSDRYAAGITFGSGTDEPESTDFQLKSPITSGLNVALTATSAQVNDGDPYLQYSMTVTNTSESSISIGEVCYKQPVTASLYKGHGTGSTVNVMLDRTLISPQIVLAPEEAAVIHYRLQTDHSESTVSGVKIVSWQFGSDEDVAAMIDAAEVGTIDLHADGGWQVGDMRECEVAGFTGGGDVRNDTQKIDLTITSFGDYNGSGSVMTVDFAEALATPVRMHSSNSNAGGYGESEMCTTTLPALYEAMPEWLKSRMLPFSVKTSAGSNSDDIVDVADNKLALRSEVEIHNGTDGGSKAGEGVAVPWYMTANKMRQKRRGRSGSTNTYWLRSPANNSTQYVTVNKADASTYGKVNASTANGFAPFFCL